MSETFNKFCIDDTCVTLGKRTQLQLPVSQSYSGTPLEIPITLIAGDKPGPVVAIVAAVHGNELNGTGIIRSFITDPSFELEAGILVLIPVVNILGFENHSRYLPDRRDLNREFPGKPDGNLAQRYADAIYTRILKKCDYCIDLHTASVRKTNFPNVRGNLKIDKVKELALAFGTELVVHGTGPKGSLRRAASDNGCPTIILEAGEVLKVEPGVVEVGQRGIKNVLMHLGMISGEPYVPEHQSVILKTKWIRSNYGGFIEFHAAPGTVIRKDEPIATCSDLLGEESNVVSAPVDGIILGMTTLPFVKPGDPVCHLAIPSENVDQIDEELQNLDDDSLHDRIKEDLAKNIHITEPYEED